MSEDRTPRRMRVIGKQAVAAGVVAVTLADPDGAAVPDWEPGAHIDLVLGDITRQYSLCGDPSDRWSLTVAVLLDPNGRGGSAYVHDKLEVGDLIPIAGPRNAFPLSRADSYLFVAGGIGITPLAPMLRAVGGERPWRLLYGGRTRASMAFADELAAAYSHRVELCPQDECGLLDLETALDALAPGAAVYCCGPEPLLQAVENACCARDHLTLHVERFAPKEIDPAAPMTSFEVELARSGEVVTIQESETVLDALERRGMALEFSCREGTCGTCEVAVLAGRPDHRDSVLAEDEQAANDAMMICVSRSHTPRIVLDL